MRNTGKGGPEHSAPDRPYTPLQGMNEENFVNKREGDWQKLAALCDRADTSPTLLKPEELRQLVRLYRRASGDLAFARTRSNNVPLIDFLNDLVARAYGILYRAPRKPIFKSLVGAAQISAQTVRRRKWFVLTSLALLLFSSFGTYGLLSVRSDMRSFFIPDQFKGAFDEWKKGKFPERSTSQSALMTGFYMGNNPRTAIVAGSLGAASFGMLSVMVIVQNGAILGTLAHEVAPLGHLDFLLTSISPHGVPEMSGMVISGSAGLLLGFALINPGKLKRGDALRAVGKDAITLLATSVVLMFIAAPIEGFFSFNPRVPGWLKVVVAAISLAAWIAFWSGFGKTEEERLASSAQPLIN